MTISRSRFAAPGPTLETERLILRPPAAEDFEPFAALMASDETAHFIGGVQPRSVAWRGFAAMVGSWIILGFGMFSVFEKSSGQWVGRLGPIHPDGWPGNEIGWGLAREFWGKGYAVEGSRAAMDWAFTTLGWTDAIHSIHPENVASQGVARRLGSVNRGPVKLPAPFEETPMELWGQTREEWERAKKAPR